MPDHNDVIRIASIVEGHGEVQSVPILIRRLAAAISPDAAFEVLRPIRIPRNRLLKPDELDRAIELAGRMAGSAGRVFVLVDADDDCPKEIAERIRNRATRTRPDVTCAVVVAKSEYEAWFLAAAPSISAQRGLADSLVSPPDVESIRDAKGWLTRNMTGPHSYSETLDQPALTAVFDIQSARNRSPSFDKMWREAAALLR